jgi:preprotein translocase subunit SecA
VPPQSAPGDANLDELTEALQREFSTQIDPKAWIAQEPELDGGTFRARVLEAVDAQYEAKVSRYGAQIMRSVERDFVLRNLDKHWREHLAAMDYLRQGIHLRGYAQKDYRFEFKREAFELFSAMLDRVKHDTASMLARVEIRDPAEVEREEAEQRARLMRALQAQHAEAGSALQAPGAVPEQAPLSSPGAPSRLPGTGGGGLPPPGVAGQAPFVRGERKVGRNEPCPCGSGKKYKQCHGSLSA